MGEFTKLGDVSYIDLPTGHWRQFARPEELATAIVSIVGTIGEEQPALDLQPGSNPYRDRVSTYTIGEAASLSGFTASALRYYEDIGLVEPPGRTAGGYRVYDDESLDRLAFIARAKQLGCSLDEITDLAGVWDGQRCGPVQRRFHELVTDKILDAETRAAELAAFSRQLRSAADTLGAEPVDGPCGSDCACMAGRAAEVPVACTLERGSMSGRLSEWNHILASATRRTAVAGGLRIEFDRAVDLAELGRLIGAEQQCCAFFEFALSVDAGGIALDVHGPDVAAELITDLFGAPDR